MVNHLEKQYPSTNIVALGFSLGGNIVTKYMGEQKGKLPHNGYHATIGAISICQGYNAVEYVYYTTINMKIENHFISMNFVVSAITQQHFHS